MPRRVAKSSLNASTIDIMNVIRANASYDYQQSVPKVTSTVDIPSVGQIIYGTPAFANQFVNALVNRIALVRVNSATFNNPYNRLKKGYLEFGETVEDVFVEIAKVVEYDPEKTEERELKRTLPDVKSAFYTVNWSVMYPVTINDMELRKAFLSMEGVQNLIASIVEQVYQGYEYDEFLLFKYLIIKGYNNGAIAKVNVTANDMDAAAIAFRGYSNLITFRTSDYTEQGVLTATPKERQIIFMDAMFNAKFDVSVLASAFNMEKADFMGRLYLIDSFQTFDNKRFMEIFENTTQFVKEASQLQPVTATELSAMSGVEAIIFDEEWFQIYDNLNKFTEKYAASGLYWNYFYHTWKIICYSPFANAIAFTTDTVTAITSITLTVASKSVSDSATVLTFTANQTPSGAFFPYALVQTEDLTEAGIAVGPQGFLIIPSGQDATAITLEAMVGDTSYVAGSTIKGSTVAVGSTISLTIPVPPTPPTPPET